MKRKGQSEIAALGVAALVIGIIAVFVFNSIYFVQSGKKAVIKRFGVVNETVINEGMHFKTPLIDSVYNIIVTPITDNEQTLTYTKDNQPIEINYSVMWSFPVENLSENYVLYGSNPYDFFARSKVVDTLKAVGGKYTASDFVNKREIIRKDLIQAAKLAVINSQNNKSAINIIDIPITNIDFDDQYEEAIKAKQVASQKAQEAEYKLQQAKVDAQSAIAKAEGEAKSLTIKAQAIAKNPQVVRLNEIEKWNGVIPLEAKTVIIGGDSKALVETK